MTSRVFFLFAPAFKDWPFLIAEEMQGTLGKIQLAGLVTGMENTFRHVSRRLREAGYGPLDHLAALESQWLATPAEPGRLEHYESLLGAEAVQRLIISDRHLGAGFVSGARFPETPLNVASASSEMRHRYIVGMLDYLFGSLTQNRPDLVFCYAIAGAPAYAIAMLCEHLDIPFLRLTHSRVGARHVIDSSPLGLMTEVAKVYERSEQDPSIVADTLEEAREYIKSFRNKAEAPQYTGLFHEIQQRNLSTKRLLRDFVSVAKPVLLPHTRPKTASVRHPSHWQRARHRAAVWAAARRAVRTKTFTEQDELPTSKFVYYPLHFDPEASTMVFAPYHTDQINVVECLAKATPPSMKVVVKEHLPMVGLRPAGFYERLKRIPGVVLASPTCDPFELIRRTEMTVAITGTAAWESLLLGKPTVTLGDVPFNVVSKGLWNCPDLTQLPRVIETARRDGEFDDDVVVRYLAAIFKSSFDLPYELLWTSVSKKELEQHRTIGKTIARHLAAKVAEGVGAAKSATGT